MCMKDDVIADQRHWTPVLVCFCPENIPRRRECTRGKSNPLISFQTVLRYHSYLTLIKLLWITCILSFISCLHCAVVWPLETCICAHVITPLDINGTWASQGPHQPSADVAFLVGELTTNCKEDIKRGGVWECCGGFPDNCSVNKLQVKKQGSM